MGGRRLQAGPKKRIGSEAGPEVETGLNLGAKGGVWS